MQQWGQRIVLGIGPISALLLFSPLLWAQANLEDPSPHSFQSGIGIIRGWVCRAARIDIVFDDRDTLQAAYGTSREDTRSVCGTAQTGFGLLFNWNNLGDGAHTVRALADGIEFGRATITVTTLGTDFLRGKSADVQVFDFPQAGADLSLVWQESMQNFAITQVIPNSLAIQLARGKIMWIGAHPDDEVLIAPLLGDLCVERQQVCTLLVATRGEAGPCKLSNGCHPDLATVREQEMRDAAALYGAQLVQWTLPDQPVQSPEEILTVWAGRVGGEGMLINTLANAIATAAPDVILLFDPRHGTTCHPHHRAIAALTLAALQRLNTRSGNAYLHHPGPDTPLAYLVATRLIQSAGNNVPYIFSLAVPEDTAVRTYDANQRLNGLNDTAWAYLVRDAQRQPSQFSAVEIAALQSIPTDARRTFLLPLTHASGTLDSRYTSLCQ
jgi:LmbE family N-acetylglucosaminyl deacetylase